jgi:hypothetical protein
MSKDEALKLALDWYDSGHEDREEFQAMIENLLATPVQEPVAWMDKYGEIYKDVPEVLSTDTPLYTTPPAAQRQWVGLTDEQRTEIRREHYARTLPLMDAVEAKLKELNT